MSKGKNNSREQFVTPDLSFTPKGLYIGGKWLESVKGKRFESINPANMEILGEVPLADEHDVNRAVLAAKEAFICWKRMRSRKEQVIWMPWLINYKKIEMNWV